jgi:hypothetical protein
MRDGKIRGISNGSVTEMKRFEQRVKKLNMYDRSIIQDSTLTRSETNENTSSSGRQREGRSWSIRHSSTC